MDELLDKTNLEFRERARHIADTVVRPIAAQLDRDSAYPWPVIDALRKDGLMGVWIPKEYGGLGFSATNYNRAVGLVATWCGSTVAWLSTRCPTAAWSNPA